MAGNTENQAENDGMAPLGQLSDEALMSAYAAGDEGAFSELFARYEGFLTNLVRRRLREPEAIADVVQQTFLKLHRGRGRYEAGRKVRPWLSTIAFNLIRDHLRRGYRKHEVAGELEAPAPPQADPVVELQLRARVHEALGQLPPKQREVIRLHWFEGLTYREIAERYASTPTAIKLHGYRGKRALRELLTESRALAA